MAGGVALGYLQGDGLGLAGEEGDVVVGGEGVGNRQAVISQQEHFVEEGDLLEDFVAILEDGFDALGGDGGGFDM